MVDTNIPDTPKTEPLPVSPYDDLGETSPREECGVFNVRAPGGDVSKLIYYGLFALWHRGRRAAGTTAGDGDQILALKDLGLVPQIFDEQTLDALKGYITMGHTRHATAEAPMWEDIQPVFQAASDGMGIVLGHSGSLTNRFTLFHEAVEKGLMRDRGELPNDSTTMITLPVGETGKVDHPEGYGCNTNVEMTATALLPHLKGAFCLTSADGEALYVACDLYDVHPLCLGRLSGGWAVVSETCVLDIIGTSLVREIKPGEMVAIGASGVYSQRFAGATHAGCIFKYVYLVHPNSSIRSRSVNAVRLELDRQLVRESPAGGDLVMPVPESGTPVAVSYAQKPGIPSGQGLTKGGYVGRTFIQSSQMVRQLGIRLKLSPLKEVTVGKRLVVAGGPIVRGSTQRTLIRMLRETGAKEIHIRIAASPVKWSCFYDIDFASPGKLLANGVDENNIVAGIATAIGADNLGFVSIDGIVATSEQVKTEVCCACFDSEYPLGLPEGNPNAAAVERMQVAQAVKVATSNQP